MKRIEGKHVESGDIIQFWNDIESPTYRVKITQMNYTTVWRMTPLVFVDGRFVESSLSGHFTRFVIPDHVYLVERNGKVV